MVDVPLLNRNRDFEVFNVINLPIPFPNNATQEKLGDINSKLKELLLIWQELNL